MRPLRPVLLSVLLPGLGHIYSGALGLAVAFLLADALGGAALELLAATGSAGIFAFLIGKPALKVLLRIIAMFTVRLGGESKAPAGAYAFFVIASLALPFALGAATGRFVTMAPLTADGEGFESGERIVAERFGGPSAGSRALYFADWPDSGVDELVPTPRQARVGVVAAVAPDALTIDGRVVPVADWGGAPVGVLLSPSDGGMRWNRLGVH